MGVASTMLNISYLQRYSGEIQTEYNVLIFGYNMRALVYMPVRLSHKSCSTYINVIFKVDTGVPISTLTTETIQKLYQNCPNIENTFLQIYSVRIAGHEGEIQQSQAHYKNLNILGGDFFTTKYVKLVFDYKKIGGGDFKLVIQGSRHAEKQNKVVEDL